MTPPTRSPRHGEEGIALIYVAVFLMVSLWFVSLAIDVGKIMAARTELQAAADAAALAGASALDPETAELDTDLAKARAVAAGGENKAMEGIKTSVLIDPDNDVEFPGVRQIKVTVYRDAAHANPVLLHFAQTLGVPNIGVQANATAEVGPLTDLCEGLAPFAPEQPPYGDFSKECDSLYTLHLGAGNSVEGNFQLLDYGDCAEDDFTGSGGSAVRYYTENGWDCCFKIGEELTVDTEPGNKVGPLRQGLLTRFDADTDQAEGICHEEYTGNGKRVFLCPVIENFDVNGKKEVRILKFAAFFLRYRPNGSMVQQGVKGQFIDYVAPGLVGDIPPDSTSVFGVHLIE